MTAADERKPGPGAHAGKLERPWVRRQLMIECAKGELTNAAMAKKYSCVTSAIDAFKKRHKPEIAAMAQNITDEFVGLWVSQKVNRLSAYQADIEVIEKLLEGAEEDGTISVDLLKAKHRALRQVAEEVGQLPSRIAMHVDNRAVHYTIKGVDTGNLR